MSETTDCAKRAVRIKALRAKAASTEFPEERETFNEKADELQAKNDAVGYVDPDEAKRRDSVFSDFWAEYMAAQRQSDQDARVRKYQEYIRRNEARQSGDCIHDWAFLQSSTHGPICTCKKCGVTEQRVWAPGGTASSYSEHEYNAETGEWEEVTRPRRKTRVKTESTERRTRVDHSQCYAEGLHDKSKAGRASCRRHGMA